MRTTRWIHVGILSAALAAGGMALAEPAVAGGDRGFLTQALATNRSELALGRLAIERAATPAVREMGQKMVQKHTEIGRQLDERAVALSVAVAANTAQENATWARLAALSGKEFDEAFKQTIDGIHRRELALYEAEAKSTTSRELHTLVQGRVVSLRKSLVDSQPVKQDQDW